MPVCYLKTNKLEATLSSVYANFAVRGSRTDKDERQRLHELIAKMSASLKTSDKALPNQATVTRAVLKMLDINEDAIEEPVKVRSDAVVLDEEKKQSDSMQEDIAVADYELFMNMQQR